MIDVEQIRRWLVEQQAAMLSLTEALVNIDSGSHDKAGNDRVADRLGTFYAEQGLVVENVPSPTHGRATCVRTGNRAAGLGGKGVLLIGHRDTVFPPGEATRRPFSVRGERAYGPGVSDMKVGLVMQAFVTAALHRFAPAAMPLTMLTTADEEISSPWSRPLLEREARQAVAVFNAEPGRPNGGVVIARKGSVFLRLDVDGRAAHSGANFSDGASAITALARKVVALDQLSDRERGITLNVGTLEAGQSVNTVAPNAQACIDLRYERTEDRDDLVARIEAVARERHLDGTSARTTIYGEMLPMPQRPSTLALFAIYKEAAAQAGFDTHGLFTGGCSDSGFTSAAGAPTLCAVGPTGGKGHTVDEFVELTTLVPRTLALAFSTLEVARRGGVPAA